MSNYQFHKELGSRFNALITLIIFVVLLRLFGDSVMDTAVISLISIFLAYPLVGYILRLLGIWKKK